jgi:pimeloyl-ACP methyl ester carboxylesterase
MGTGELARYAKLFGTDRVGKFAFLASLEPGMLGQGVAQSTFDDIAASAKSDRFAWFSEFYANFYNLDENLGTRISQQVVDANRSTAAASAPVAAYAVVSSWIEDFTADVAAVRASGKPALIVHGTADRILPIDATGRPFHAAFPEAEYHEIDGAPHGLAWTHAEELNSILLPFVQK